MKKQFILYIFYVILLLSLLPLINSFTLPLINSFIWNQTYRLVNIEKVDIPALNEKNIIALEPKQPYLYVLTSDKRFFVLDDNAKSMKAEYNLDFLDQPIDMGCNYAGCLIAHKTKGQYEIFHLNSNGTVAQKWAIFDDIQITKIISKTTNDGNRAFTVHQFFVQDSSDKLHLITMKLFISSKIFFRASKRYTQKIFADVVKDVSIKREAPSSQSKHLQDLFKAYKINTMEIKEESYKKQLLTIVGNRSITYAKIDTTSDDSYSNGAIKPQEAYTIKHHQDIKEVFFHFKDIDVADKVVFLSNDDHKLYTADVGETFTKKAIDNIGTLVSIIFSTIFYYILVIFD